jgi:hypothetical protein
VVWAVSIVIASAALSNGFLDSVAYSLVVVETLAISLSVPLLLGRKGVAD